MKYLLDTHTLLWTLFEPENLSDEVRSIITDVKKEVYISLVSYWEISLKYSIGKLSLTGITPEKLPDRAKEAGFTILPLDEYDVSSFHKLPRLVHRDPFDRLLIWQGIQKNLTVLTKDKDFKEYTHLGLKILW